MKKMFIGLALMVSLVTYAEMVSQDLLSGSGYVYLADNTAITNTTIGVSYLKTPTTRGTNSAAFGWVESATIEALSTGAAADNATITLDVYALNAGGTNIATFVFERGDGYVWDQANTWSVAAGPTALVTTNNVVMTNVPSAFLNGAKYIRIKRVTNDDVAGNSSNVLRRVTFNQWKN